MVKNHDPNTPLYTTGDLARLTGNTLRTVRYYEEIGLLSPVPRKHGGHRLFTQQDVHKLRTITDLRAVGLTLEQVAEVMNIRLRVPNGHAEVERALKMIDEQLTIVRDRLETLQRVERELASTRGLLDKCRSCGDLLTPGACENCLRNPGLSPIVNVMMTPQNGAAG